ncbi:glutathione S-transferase family protein [Geminicoccus roseus]|uniref:glutathione S-transferase family protein n=1 Tax=Geminicoccus roseus TaxID=404900 RepID=UPI00041B82DE|nr:glutathione S-transferase family protein [Geminicoccus roseus]
MLTLHDYLPSGNGYKVRLLLHQLGIPFRLVEHDILQGGTRDPDFLALNPNGRIPLLQLQDGSLLAESGAILCYLALDSALWPAERFERALTLQWLFFEQNSHEPAIAVARFSRMRPDGPHRADLPGLLERGHAALAVMERHLAGRSYFVAERYGIADIALYAYTHVAHEGGFDLAGYPNVRAWLERVAAQPGHVPITWKPN